MVSKTGGTYSWKIWGGYGAMNHTVQFSSENQGRVPVGGEDLGDPSQNVAQYNT